MYYLFYLYLFPFAFSFIFCLIAYWKGFFDEYVGDENGMYLKKPDGLILKIFLYTLSPILNILIFLIVVSVLIASIFSNESLFNGTHEWSKINATRNRIRDLSYKKMPEFLISERKRFVKNLETVLEEKNNKYFFIYNMLNSEEKYLFGEKLIDDLFKISKIEFFEEEKKNQLLDILNKANEDLEYIINNRAEEVKKAKMEEKYPYLKEISKEEYELISSLTKEVDSLKNKKFQTHETNYEYEKIINKIYKLDKEINSLEIDRNQYLDQISEVKEKIELYKNNLTDIKKKKDKIEVEKLLSRYKKTS